MEEKLEELYQEYLKEKLDLVFEIDSNKIIDEMTKKEENQNTKSPEKRNKYDVYGFMDADTLARMKKMYDGVEEFSEGFAVVEDDLMYNYIDVHGELLCEEWYDEAYDFSCGYGVVRKNEMYNYVNRHGELLCEEWYDEAYDFSEEYALVKKDDEYNFINTNGKLISKQWYEDAFSFCEGFAVVKKNGKYNYIDGNANLISETWYDITYDFAGGYGTVKNNGKKNCIDSNGKLISEEWYDKISNISEGYLVVKNENGYNYMDEKGELLSEIWFDYACDFDDGYASVRIDDMYTTIDIKGKLHKKSEKEFEIVSKNGRFNFVDSNGEILCDGWYDEIYDFEDEYAKVFLNEKQNYINKEAKLISDDWHNKINLSKNGYFIAIDNHRKVTIVFDKNKNKIEGFEVKKLLIGGYKCFNNTLEFKVKYKPIKNYGTDFILCYEDGKEEFYLYNINSDTYEKLGKITDVTYDDNFIFCGENTYLLYEGKKIDITVYYSKLAEYFKKNKVNINTNIDIMTKVDFDYMNINEAAKFLKEEKRKNERIKEEQLKEKQQKAILMAKKQKEDEEKQINKELLEALKAFKEIVDKINTLKSKTGNNKLQRVTIENLFIEVDDHKEIMDELKDKLEFIDLSRVNFKNVDISGIDFRGSNIDLYPQEVYKKDLKGCNFTGVHISPFIDFRGVDIRGAKFSVDNDSSTIDVLPQFKDSIYDEKTTYNGEPIVDILNTHERSKYSYRRVNKI